MAQYRSLQNYANLGMKVEQSMEVPHQVQQMYGLVADIEAYPEFLPWCSGSAILYEQDNEIEARVDLNYLMIRQHFITHNHYVENKSIEVRLVEGPFTYLEGKWQFTATSEDSCLIHFELHYEFSNFLISKAFGPVFKVISNTMVEAFIKEADKRYG